MIQGKAEEDYDEANPGKGNTVDQDTPFTQFPWPVFDGSVLASIEQMESDWKGIRHHVQAYDSAEDGLFELVESLPHSEQPFLYRQNRALGL